MRHISVALIYMAFFGLIGATVWLTGSALPLWALLLTPSYKHEDDNKSEAKNDQ